MSSSFNHIDAVFSLGCTPISLNFLISSSIKTLTIWLVSFNTPRTVTEPLWRPRYFSKSSSLANVKGLSLKLFLNSFKLTLLFPAINTK